ncbi:MAG: porin family protein [Paludibacter sp.]|nr:porin family protein [Paludibacter sp.]
MKKLTFAAAFLLIAGLVSAQLNFGIKAGYNSSLSLSNVSSVQNGDYTLDNVKSEMSNGFHAGAFARLGIKKVYIQPELLYSMGKKDYTITFQDVMDKNVTYDKFVTISTVDIPVLLGYKVLDLKLANLRVFAGPKFRLNAGSKLEFDNLVSEDGSDVTIDDLSKDIKNSQVGLEAGVGVDFLMLTLDARFNLIGDMYQTKVNDVNIDKLSANTFVISLGWKIF